MQAGTDKALPTFALSAFYFAYFAALGALVPYYSRYLISRGYDAADIGLLMAGIGAVRVLAPFAWALLADKAGRRMPVVRGSMTVATLSFGYLLFEPGFYGVALCLALYQIFANAVLPQMEAVTFSHLREQAARYGRIRQWGSVSYMLLVVLTGLWLDAFGIGQFPLIVLLCLGATVLVTLRVKDVPHEPGRAALPFGAALRRPVVWVLLAAALLQQAATQPFYLFFDVLLSGQGYSGGAVGALVALGVLAEIGMFIIIGRYLERFGAQAVLMAVLVCGCGRWLLLATLSAHPWAMIVAQLLHAATFAAAHASAMYALARLFPLGLQGKAQGLFAAMVYGGGGIVGSLLSGYLGKAFGYAAPFYASAALCALALLLVMTGLNGLGRLRPVDPIPAPD